MTSLSLEELCARMQAQGFQYGSLVSGDTLLALPEPARMTPFTKPTAGTLYFSCIQTYKEPTLDWAQWVIAEDFRMEKYAKASVLFAQIDETRLVSGADPRFGKGGEWCKDIGPYIPPWIHWAKVADEQFMGVKVAHEELGENYATFTTWDVDTIAVWDGRCIGRTAFFRNHAGESWRYGAEDATAGQR